MWLLAKIQEAFLPVGNFLGVKDRMGCAWQID